MKYKTLTGMVTTQVCGRYFLVTTEGTIEISETAFFCLKCLEQDASISDLCQALAEQYDIGDKEGLISDVRSLVKDLLDKRLLVRCTP